MVFEDLPIDAMLDILNGRYDPNPCQLSFNIDNVVEGYLEDDIFYMFGYDGEDPIPCTPDSSKIYADERKGDTYKYSDTDKKYIKVSE